MSEADAFIEDAHVKIRSRKLFLQTSQRQRATDRDRPKKARKRAGLASKELIQKVIRSEQSDGPKYTQR
jgi:hypothetical protein